MQHAVEAHGPECRGGEAEVDGVRLFDRVTHLVEGGSVNGVHFNGVHFNGVHFTTRTSTTCTAWRALHDVRRRVACST